MSDSVISTYKKLLMDNSYADLTINIQREKSHAHRALIAARCPEMFPMPAVTDKKKKMKEKATVTLKEGVKDNTILEKLLEYLYIGTVNFPKMDAEAAIHLCKAARHFKLVRLEWLCQNHLVTTLDAVKIFHVLAAANKMNEEKIKNFCLKYALEHYTDFVKNKDGLHILGIELFQEVVKAQAEQMKFNSLTLGDEPADSLLDDLKTMYDKMPYADVRFNIEGEEIACHKAILYACSDKFAPLVKEVPPNGIEVKSVSAAAFRAMLKFLYYGDDNIDPLPCCELVSFARLYGLIDVVTICENKIKTSVAVDTVLGILEVAYMPEIAHKQDLVEELKKKTFPFILEHLKEIDLGPLRGMNPSIAQDILFNIQDYQKKKRSR